MRRLAVVALLCLLIPAPLVFAAAAVPTESFGTLLHQIDAGQVAVAHVNEQTHHVSVTLKNGTKQVVDYPSTQHKFLIDTLLHHGITPIYTKHKHVAKPAHHVLRYVAAGVVVVLLLIGGGVWAYTRGPRKRPPQSAETDTSAAP